MNQHNSAINSAHSLIDIYEHKVYNLKSEYATFFIKILNSRSDELMNLNRIVSTAAALVFSAGMVTVFPELTQ